MPLLGMPFWLKISPSSGTMKFLLCLLLGCHVSRSAGWDGDAVLDGHQASLRPTRRGMDVLHPADRRPGQRLEAPGQPASTSDRCCTGTSSPTRWHSADSSPSISCGIGLQPHPANLAHCSWGRLGSMDRNLSLWEQQASSRTCTTSSSSTRPEAENDECARPRRRWRLQCGRGGHEGKVVPELPTGDGRLAYGGGRTLHRTTFSPSSTHQHTRHSPLHGLRHLRALRPEGSKSIEVPDTRVDGQWLHDQGVARAGIICPVAGMLSGTTNFLDHAGRGGPFEPAFLRDADRKAHTPLPFSLALDLLSGRTCQECTLKQDPVKSKDRRKGWETSTTYMGSPSPLGFCLRHVGFGCRVLASSSPRACTGLAGSRVKGHPEDPCRTSGSRVSSRRHGRHYTSIGVQPQQRNIVRCWAHRLTAREKDTGTKGRKKKESSSCQRRTFSTEGSQEFPRQKREPEFETEMLQLEQWKLTVWGLAAWSSLRRKDRKGAQVHHMRIPRSPFENLSEQEERVRGCGRGEDSGRSRTPRRNILKGGTTSKEDINRKQNSKSDSTESDNLDSLDAVYDSKDLEEYKARRVFVFVHHFAGKDDPLSEAMKAHAETAGLRLKIHSVEREAGSGDLLKDKPYEDHLLWAKRGHIDIYHAGFPCGTYTRLRFRQAPGLPRPVRTKSEPYGRKSNTEAEQKECDVGTILASRVIIMAKTVANRNRPGKIQSIATLENPPPSEVEGHLSAWELRNYRRWRTLSTTRRSPQCSSTHAAMKTTYLLENVISNHNSFRAA